MQKDGYIAGTDRKQSVLFPDMIDDYITPDNPVRFIDAFVDALDLKAIVLKSGMSFFISHITSTFLAHSRSSFLLDLT